ncbi:alcohol dehydrogenase, partial [Burkholderia multivorans]
MSEQVGSPFTTKEISIADPLDREVLIDVRASGLCHSDLHIVESGYGFGFPGVFG